MNAASTTNKGYPQANATLHRLWFGAMEERPTYRWNPSDFHRTHAHDLPPTDGRLLSQRRARRSRPAANGSTKVPWPWPMPTIPETSPTCLG